MPFVDSPWSSPESTLDVGPFCAVCLIDENTGKDKIKAKCYLPIRSRPGGPINKNAVHAAAGGRGITRLKGVSADAKRKAAKHLIRLYTEMGEVAPESIYRVAGQVRPKSK